MARLPSMHRDIPFGLRDVNDRVRQMQYNAMIIETNLKRILQYWSNEIFEKHEHDPDGWCVGKSMRQMVMAFYQYGTDSKLYNRAMWYWGSVDYLLPEVQVDCKRDYLYAAVRLQDASNAGQVLSEEEYQILYKLQKPYLYARRVAIGFMTSLHLAFADIQKDIEREQERQTTAGH